MIEMKKIGSIIGKSILGLVIIMGLLMAVILIIRFVKINQIKKEIAITSPNGIEEETVIEINGMKQYLNIRGQDINNPIVVVVHGGAPMTPVIHTYQPKWEENYTFVNFDRRGSGETYFLNKADENAMLETMTPDQYISDIGAVVDYVTERFEKKKVILLADSFGSLLASRYVLAHPEKVSAYVGSAQIINIEEDFELCREELLQKAQSAEDTEAVKDLSTIKTPFTSSEDWIHANGILETYAGTYISEKAKGNMMVNIMAGMQSPYFPIRHLEYYFKSSDLQKGDADYILNFDLRDYGSQFEVPVLLIYGSEDWLTRYNIGAYYESVEAPYKQLIAIPEIGHDALQLKSDAFFEAMEDGLMKAEVLQQK